MLGLPNSANVASLTWKDREPGEVHPQWQRNQALHWNVALAVQTRLLELQQESTADALCQLWRSQKQKLSG